MNPERKHSILWDNTRIGIAYFILGFLALLIPFSGVNVSPFWPASGLAISATLLLGFRVLPGIFIATFCISIFLAHTPWLPSLGISVGNTLEAAIAAFFLKKVMPIHFSLRRNRDLVYFFAFAGVVGPAISAIIGVSSLTTSGIIPRDLFFHSLFVWWLGNLNGGILVGSWILIRKQTFYWTPLKRFEAFSLILLLAITMLGLFYWNRNTHHYHNQIVFLAPFLIWTALRFDLRGTIEICIYTIILCLVGGHFFTDLDPKTYYHFLIETQGFVGVFSAATLILSSTTWQLRRSEESWRQSREMLQQVMDTIPQYIFWKDRHSILLGCNRNFARLKGAATPEELIGKSPHELNPNPQDADRYLKHDHQVIETEVGIFHHIESQDLQDGTIAWLDTTKVPLRDKNGAVVGILGCMHDISEHKRLSDALQTSEAQYRFVVDSIKEVIFQTDLKGRLTFLNAAWKTNSECSIQESLGKHLADFFAAEDRPAIYQQMDSILLQKNSRSHGEFRFQSPDGKLRNFEVGISPIRDQDQKIIGLAGTLVDTTEKQFLEEEQAKAARLESIGVLAGGIAHDFNNILTAITGNLSLARLEVESNSPLEPLLSNAEAACQKAREIARQLLTFAKGGEPIKKMVDLKKLVTDTTNFSLHGSNIMPTIEIAPGLWPVKADEGQIAQVINNLLINAAQAMPQGGALHLKLTNLRELGFSDFHSDKTPFVRLSIQDQGVGIPRDQIEKIFDPYFTTKKTGTGLGLATSYSIVKRHGGHILVTSEIGKGTLFEIFLPASPQSKPEEKKTVTLSPLKAERILSMDDDPAIRKISEKIFTKLGYSIDLAPDGATALEYYRKALESEQPYRYVLLDLTIPGGMGGLETLENLKQMDPKVCAIVVSGYSTDPVMSDCKKFGFTDAMPKPFNVNDIHALFERLTHRASNPTESV